MTRCAGARRAAALALWAAVLAWAPARAEPPADCPPTPAPASAGELQSLGEGARDRGFLWRLTKDDRTSWLYGTIHVARRDWAFPGPQVSAALRSADALALELDPLSPEVQQGLAQSIAAMRRPALPAALEERLVAQGRKDCLPDAPLAALAPLVRAMALTTLVGRRDGLDPAYGIDAVLAAYGHARQLEVVSLESPALQMAVLDPGSDEATIDWVDRSLGEIEQGAARANLARIAQAWADGTLDPLTACPGGPDCDDSASGRTLKRRVLDDRNPGLAAAIDALHASGKRVFAAVGSLHMVGPLGLPALLAERGYQVERVDFAAP